MELDRAQSGWRGREGRVERPFCCTGSLGLEEGEVEVEGEAEEELYELQQQCCCGGALGNMGPPQECGNPLLPLCSLTFSKTNSLLLQTAANDAKLTIM